jgi:hypothetical protein
MLMLCRAIATARSPVHVLAGGLGRRHDSSSGLVSERSAGDLVSI